MAYEVEIFEPARGRLEAIAYRLLGSAADAEDAVQDTFLRWQSADRALIRTPEAWLTTVLTNVCLNRLTSARARRETYVGQWLPEPVLDGDRMLGPAETAEQRESVSLAVLKLMERLSPKERAVYVLREAFGYPHGEIAQILEITESNSQQLLRRARQHLDGVPVRAVTDPAAARRVVEQFLSAALGGDIGPLIELLDDDATGVADGGGQVPARGTPIVGATAIARLLRGILNPDLARRFVGGERISMHAAVVNAAPAALVVADGERIVSVVSLVAGRDGIAALLIQANPDKLARLTRRWNATDREAPLIEDWS